MVELAAPEPRRRVPCRDGAVDILLRETFHTWRCARFKTWQCDACDVVILSTSTIHLTVGVSTWNVWISSGRRLHSFLRSGAFRGARRCLAQVEILSLNIVDDSQEDCVMLVTW